MVLRPVLREHEIPYLTRAGVGEAQQIPVTDLLVSVDAEGRIRLRSQRLGREVIPRLASAHAYAEDLPMYTFLSSLQSPTRPMGHGFGWGSALRTAKHLPRLVVGRWVFALASWQLDRSWLTRLGGARGLGERLGLVRELREVERLPRFVSVEDGDNVLPVDLDNALSVESFVELVKRREAVKLVELYPGAEELVVRGPGGKFRHELIVPLLRVESSGSASASAPLAGARGGSIARSFGPGDEWLLVRLFAGAATADEVLIEAVTPFVEELRAEGLVEGWFFTRAVEPDPHVAVVVRGGDALAAVPRLREHVDAFVRDGRIWRIQCDTYERALERFGGAAGIALSEKLFEHDSDAALEILGACEEDQLADVRWQLALRGAAAWLEDFGLDLAQKRRIVEGLRASLGAQLGLDPKVKHQLGDRFRRQRPDLDELVRSPGREDHPLAPGFAILAARSERNREVIAALRAAVGAELLERSVVPNVLRAQMNRFLRGAQEAQELVLYDFLARLLESEAARSKAKGGGGRRS